MKISVVLPAKNESAAISQTIAQIQQLQLAHEIIVVNDGSTDGGTGGDALGQQGAGAIRGNAFERIQIE